MKKETLYKLHEIQVQILDETVRICEKHNLKYYLIGGTLLGALRHKGFIPWDDDVDIVMPRDDYERFKNISKNELSNDFFMQDGNDDQYDRLFLKIRKNNTYFVEGIYRNAKMHQGIFIDIFPLDCSDDFKISSYAKIKCKFGRIICRYFGVKNGRTTATGYMKMFKPILNCFPRKTLVKFRDFCFISKRTHKSKYYVNFGSQYGIEKQTIPIDKFEPADKLEFCGKFYDVPGDYRYFLNRIYGADYMQLPPVEKRVTHGPVRLSFDTQGPDEEF